MMKGSFAACIAIVLLTLNSCRKDKDETPSPETPSSPQAYDNYSNLKVGNYWVYQEFFIDTLGNATPGTEIDSSYIEKDTVIGINTYRKMVRWKTSSIVPDIFLLRDSLSYTISYISTSYITFSSADFSTAFHHGYVVNMPGDTVAETTTKMHGPAETTVVPAGSFTTLDYRITFDMYPAYAFGTGMRYMHSRYAKNIGMISETTNINLYTTSCSERRLVRYHLE
ncbi:MAG: hypothetical protein JWO44_2457 [Bacteroidetes bacterium]|nr:hypothetical protein [Bacteroidota bacterium]